jgi:Ca-activated chloride channel family protein
MSRALAFISLIALAHPLFAQTPYRSTSSELVVLPVLVTDRPDHYVANLGRDQFTVFDNGRRVPVEFFSAEDTPVTVGLVIDASSSMRHKLQDVIGGASAFAKASNQNDEFFALSFSDDVREVTPGGTFIPARDQPALNRALGSLMAEGRTSLYDALAQALSRLSAGSRPRRALVLVSDGGDNASSTTLGEVLAAAKLSSAVIYTIGMFDELDLEKNPKVLKNLASATGGARFLPRSANEFLHDCLRIAREIRQGYTLAYVPPDRDGSFHRVHVEATDGAGRKLNVRTRPGYVAAQDATDRPTESTRRNEPHR